MKIGVALATFSAKFGSIVFTGADIYRNLQTIKSLGYNGIDLFIHQLSGAEIDDLIRFTNELNLEIPMMAAIFLAEQGVNLAASDSELRRDAVQKFKGQIETARKIKAASMPIGFIRGNKVNGENDLSYQERLADSLDELLDAAALNGVKLVLEPINRYEVNTFNRVDQSLEFIKKYHLDPLELLLDTFHMNIEDRSIEQAIKAADSKIGHIHITDSNRLAPGQGHLDYKSIIKTIRETGYDRFLTIEAFPVPSAEECARQGIDFLKQLV